MWKYYVKICLIYDETVEKWLDDDVTAQKKSLRVKLFIIHEHTFGN